MSPGIFVCVPLCVRGGGSYGLQQSSLCQTMQRQTNLIQTFRLPDKGYSPSSPPADNNSNQVACLDTRCAWHESRLGSPGVTILLGKQLQGFRETDWKATYLNQHPSLLCVSLRSEADGFMPTTTDDFQDFFKYGISLPHSRLLTRCSVSHPKYSPPSIKTCFFHTWNNRTTPQRNHKVLFFFAESASAGITELPGTWCVTGGFVWSGSNLQTLNRPPIQTNAALLGASLSFPCLVWRRETAPDITQTVNSGRCINRLPAPSTSCTLWASNSEMFLHILHKQVHTDAICVPKQ